MKQISLQGGIRMKKELIKRLWLYRKRWRTVGGFLEELCKSCKEPLLYYYRYDAMCCPCCNEWKEKIE